MSSTKVIDKGKSKAIPKIVQSALHDSSTSTSDSDSDSSSDSSDSEKDKDITPEYLKSLIETARQNAIEKERQMQISKDGAMEEDIIKVDDTKDRPLPPLNPGTLPAPYFEFGEGRFGPVSIRDPDIERAIAMTSSILAPAPPAPPPELTKSGKPPTKKEIKAMKNKTAGPSWYDLPAPSEADLPRLYREVEALRLRNQLDPKRFYKKDEGEGKGIKGLPKHFAIGTILPSSTPFGTASTDNLPRSQRKRTFVDELVDDAEAKRYAKKKFDELQSVRGAKGRATLHKKNALRKPKW
ncbi:hypothetical protein SERLA73DRAFT_79848 [Serpula lacrymans var. lacrymans S7.3]|uniref:Fcf2 pre-rRNA processing C-terminal domain-containing protein n=1 Tax=Serpula lacrymans var. lacrymans (strain S7.3) TaxID=936435 RepID=F8QHT6_SERL3|nr:hypothetical protein SERLA73DRAFT_79848 [Serpula lacrymans var. lacrymans S7.3]